MAKNVQKSRGDNKQGGRGGKPRPTNEGQGRDRNQVDKNRGNKERR